MCSVPSFSSRATAAFASPMVTDPDFHASETASRSVSTNTPSRSGMRHRPGHGSTRRGLRRGSPRNCLPLGHHRRMGFYIRAADGVVRWRTVVLQADDRHDGLADPFGRFLDLAVPEMGVA